MRCLVLLCIAGRGIKWSNHFGNTLVVSYKVKRTPTIWPSNSLLGILPKRNENSSNLKIWHINFTGMFQSSFIHKIKHPSTGEWINKLHIHATGILLNNQKGKTCGHMQQHRWISQTCWARGRTQKNVYCIIPLIWNSRTGKTNLWWLKSAQWLPGKLTTEEHERTFWENGYFLYLD